MIVVNLAGHLGKDPETRRTPEGREVTNLALATNIRSKDKEETIWWNITVWDDRTYLKKILPHLKKGSGIYVSGEITRAPRIYTDKEGRQQVTLDVSANMIKFYSSGKPDRLAPADTAAANQYSEAGVVADNPFGASMNAYGRNNSPYNGSNNSTAYGKASFSPDESTEDELPF